MLAQLSRDEVAWDHTTIYQVDERVVPVDDDLRNLKHIREALRSTPVTVEAMDVDQPDLEEAARQYAEKIPDALRSHPPRSWSRRPLRFARPDDPVLQVTDRLVSLSGPYQGTQRMTLTYPALDRADQLLWLVSGEDKVDALARLLDGDTSIPAGRVDASASLVMADRAALPS